VRVDSGSSFPAKVLPALALALLVILAVAASAQDEAFQVLVLHSFRSNLPANTDWHRGIVRGLSSAPELHAEIDIEAPDLSRFSDTDYVGELLDIYRRKYRDHQPDLIIPTYTPALLFLLQHGEHLFPGIPIVFLGADGRFVASQELASHITGVTSRRDLTGTLELALQLHPKTQRVATIVGSGDLDKMFERDARQAAQSFEDRMEFVWLQGMPMGELVDAVRQLPPDSVILYVTQFEDRNGKLYVPQNTVKALSNVGTAPIYGLWDTLLGHGIIGGRLATLEEDGYRAAQMGLRILQGEAPAAVPLVDRQQNPAIFNGRELARWGIDEDRLPAGSHILYRQPSLWEEHRGTILIAGSIMALQGFLIVALWLNGARLDRARTTLVSEHDRRMKAEAASVRLRGRLARFSSERALGTVATTIAHEINQPLIAIQNYTQAARRRAQSPADQQARLQKLFEKIELQASRAGDIVQRVRALVGTHDPDLHPVSVRLVAEEVVDLMEPELVERSYRVDCKTGPNLSPVLADKVQLQLVLINLLRNALQSVAEIEGGPSRVIRVEIHQINEREQQISVVDRGPDVPPDQIENLFEPFYSDSGGGMGIGLAICRSIIDAHGGRIWYTPNPAGGAMFHFTLRLEAP
jgi:signal transduction histidine kinase